MSNLPSEIAALSPAEKADLIDALWESLEADAPLTNAQAEEIDRRIARYQENPTDVISWEQVKSHLLKSR
jgi:putative addiction module component (TIGR02574 family)